MKYNKLHRHFNNCLRLLYQNKTPIQWKWISHEKFLHGHSNLDTTNGILKPEFYKIKIKSLFYLSVKFNHRATASTLSFKYPIMKYHYKRVKPKFNTTCSKMKRKLEKECGGCDLVNVSRWSGIAGATLVHEDDVFKLTSPAEWFASLNQVNFELKTEVHGQIESNF